MWSDYIHRLRPDIILANKQLLLKCNIKLLFADVEFKWLKTKWMQFFLIYGRNLIQIFNSKRVKLFDILDFWSCYLWSKFNWPEAVYNSSNLTVDLKIFVKNWIQFQEKKWERFFNETRDLQ